MQPIHSLIDLIQPFPVSHLTICHLTASKNQLLKRPTTSRNYKKEFSCKIPCIYFAVFHSTSTLIIWPKCDNRKMQSAEESRFIYYGQRVVKREITVNNVNAVWKYRMRARRYFQPVTKVVTWNTRDFHFSFHSRSFRTWRASVHLQW